MNVLLMPALESRSSAAGVIENGTAEANGTELRNYHRKRGGRQRTDSDFRDFVRGLPLQSEGNRLRGNPAHQFHGGDEVVIFGHGRSSLLDPRRLRAKRPRDSKEFRRPPPR